MGCHGLPSTRLATDPGQRRRSGRHDHQSGGTGHGNLGVLPGAETPAALLPELTVAIELARFAGPPLVPVAGLVALLVLLFWTMGALLVWATAVRRPLLGLVPPLLVGLQLATVDRFPASPIWIVAGVVLIAAALAAIAHDERMAGSGRLRRPDGQSAPAENPGTLTAFTGLTAARRYSAPSLSPRPIPAEGSFDWRTRGPLGSGVFGGISYNLFAGIQQTLVGSPRSLSSAPRSPVTCYPISFTGG